VLVKALMLPYTMTLSGNRSAAFLLVVLSSNMNPAFLPSLSYFLAIKFGE
jgi:hypothetical protein